MTCQNYTRGSPVGDSCLDNKIMDDQQPVLTVLK